MNDLTNYLDILIDRIEEAEVEDSRSLECQHLLDSIYELEASIINLKMRIKKQHPDLAEEL